MPNVCWLCCLVAFRLSWLFRFRRQPIRVCITIRCDSHCATNHLKHVLLVGTPDLRKRHLHHLIWGWFRSLRPVLTEVLWWRLSNFVASVWAERFFCAWSRTSMLRSWEISRSSNGSDAYMQLALPIRRRATFRLESLPEVDQTCFTPFSYEARSLVSWKSWVCSRDCCIRLVEEQQLWASQSCQVSTMSKNDNKWLWAESIHESTAPATCPVKWCFPPGGQWRCVTRSTYPKARGINLTQRCHWVSRDRCRFLWIGGFTKLPSLYTYAQRLKTLKHKRWWFSSWLFKENYKLLRCSVQHPSGILGDSGQLLGGFWVVLLVLLKSFWGVILGFVLGSACTGMGHLERIYI